MKQKRDEVRTLAVALHKEFESEKQKQNIKDFWGRLKTWRDLPDESVAVWDAVAKCAIKRLTCVALLAALLFLPCRSQAPVPVALGLALKCVAIGTITSTAVIIYRCEPNYFLIRVRSDDEPDHWLVSQASEATVKKNEGWLRCEGPFKDRTEPDFRAWVNNQNPGQPMFPCGPLGIIPNATRTNWMRVTLQQSTDGGNSYASVASTVTAFGADGSDDGYSFAMLPFSGTNGLTRSQLDEISGASAVFTNTASSAIFRTAFEEVGSP